MTIKSNDDCAICGKSNDCKECSRCHRKSYCSVRCQKQDWKSHKKQCFAPDAVCTRCEETIRSSEDTITMCRVPHPEHLVENCGSEFGAGVMKIHLTCRGCGSSFTKKKGIAEDTPQAWTFDPPSAAWCFQGTHTVKSIPPTDQRRVQKDVVCINADSNVQSNIDALNENTRILTIKAASGLFDDSVKPVLNKELPKLQELHLIDVCFASVKLNAQTAPNLERLEMQNIPDECDIQVSCKRLKEFDMRYYHGDDMEWLKVMLSEATELEIFKSYKLGVYPEIRFAGNSIREIHLHRSDCLSNVSLWAPRLQFLRMQGCYSLETLHILEDHPLRPQVPDFRPSVFTVDTTNSNLSRQVHQTLRSNPRVLWPGEEVDENAGFGGMEAMFRTMRSQGM